MRADSLTAEDWKLRNSQLEEHLLSRKTALDSAYRQRNATRLLDVLSAGVNAVFGDVNRTKSGNGEKLPPFQTYCKRNKHHPDYPALISAIQQGDNEQIRATMRKMSQDG